MKGGQMETEIFREPTKEEQQDFISLMDNEPNIIDKFNEMLSKKELEYTKLKKPFCRRCAILEFKDKLAEKVKEMERKVGFADLEKIKIDIKKLDTYAKESRFEETGIEEVTDPGRWKGAEPKLKHYKNYKCKVLGCGISILQD
jgi:hypothetical protein